MPEMPSYARRFAIRSDQTVKRLHREGTIENIGVGRASNWKLASA
jgi:hypothetical protein